MNWAEYILEGNPLITKYRPVSLQLLTKKRLQVDSDLNALAHVLSWFDQFNQPPVPPQVWLQCQLVLAEGFTNAVRHAHRDQPPSLEIEVEVTIFSTHLEMKIWDGGPPFDLEPVLEHLPDRVDPEAEGGRGIFLMRQIADHLSYGRMADARNCLFVSKQYLADESAE